MTTTNIQREIDKECVHSLYYIDIERVWCAYSIIIGRALFKILLFIYLSAHQFYNRFKINLTFMNRRRYAYYFI